jgi:hypothetical protein
MVRNNDDSSINDFRSGENTSIKTEKNDQENMLTSCSRDFIL